ncbi:hypothetical protein [Cellulomonas oligotrophica]|uniref:Uncharacterized protein n=1 Tax=Cellulomonas oligotrophica TaxID=931536 RepID=A0A7Y9FIR0_9CELL|nr:hypothetical protein [Cellulomonas oligotrophica]NYD88073.1 hypothetical protein [Cellulomonas oligotrophica]GIG33580.1 hypothetical protein Col01nite_27390 [Cellulomonas oligotrophica]
MHENAAARAPWDAWDAALDRYRVMDVDAATYDAALLERLRPT